PMGRSGGRGPALLQRGLFLVVVQPVEPGRPGPAFLLMMVLAAAAATGSTLSLLAAALVGSFVIQSELGTAPAVFAVLVVGVLLWGLVQLRKRAASQVTPRPRPLTATHRRHLVAVVGTGLIVVLAW